MNGPADNPVLLRPVAARILEIRRHTPIDATWRLAWDQPPAPGQFFEVSLPRVGEAPISASGWGEGYVDLTIRRVGELTTAIFATKVGELLFLRGPYGHGWPVATLAGRPLVIAAGGTGLAPVRGLIEQVVADASWRAQATVLVGFRSPDDVLFRDDLARWLTAADVRVTVDRGGDGWTGRVGVVTRLIPELPWDAAAVPQAVVVGPSLMMKFTVKALLDRGLPPERIWVSYERRMSCGVGKCGHCKIHDKYCCVDGPVFNFAEAQGLFD